MPGARVTPSAEDKRLEPGLLRHPELAAGMMDLATDSEGDVRLSGDSDLGRLCSALGTADPTGLLDVLPDAIVVVDEQGRIVYTNRRLEGLLGWSPQTLAGRPVTTLVPERLRAAHQRGFGSFLSRRSRRLEGRALKVTSLSAAGIEVPIEMALAAYETAEGKLRLVAAIRDASERVELERHSSVVDLLLRLVADGTDDLGERFIEIVGEVLGWDVAVLWAVETEHELVARGFWSRAEVDAFEFQAQTEALRLEVGVGLPGKTWQAGQPAWLSDLSLDDNFRRRESASTAGLTSGFAFPLLNRSRTVGVVELYSTRPRDPDPGLLSALGTIGERLGDLLARGEADRERLRLQEEQQRLMRTQGFLLNAARALSRAAGYLETLDRLAQVAVPSLADLCLIDVMTDRGTLERMVARHADPALQHLADELRQYPPDPEGRHPSLEVIAARRPCLSAHMSDDFLAATTLNERHLEIVRELRFTSYMSIPLTVSDRALGALTLVSAGSGRRFGSEDLSIAQELAGHAAAVIDRARHHDLDRATVRYLQDAFLPSRLPAAECLEMAASYLPASDAVVGGDWYDVFPLEEGTCIVVGDVAGHGLRSVAVMAELRNAVRAFATADSSPASILTRLNRMLCRLEPEETATAIAATWDPQHRALLWATAGHPPLLRCRTGEFAYLTSPTNPLLGALPDVEYGQASKLLRPGTTLVMYTDGLVESRGTPIDQAMDQLLVFATGLHELSPKEVCDDILNWRLQRAEREDDICVLAVRLA